MKSGLQDRQYWGGFFENTRNQTNYVPNVVTVAEQFPPDKHFLFKYGQNKMAPKYVFRKENIHSVSIFEHELLKYCTISTNRRVQYSKTSIQLNSTK